MDRSMLQDHLAQAEEHIRAGIRNIVQQRRVIAELERDGHDAAEARKLLKEFEEILALHLAGRDRLQKDLGKE